MEQFCPSQICLRRCGERYQTDGNTDRSERRDLLDICTDESDKEIVLEEGLIKDRECCLGERL